MKKKDTIFALASGPGKAAISIIRISGPSSINTANTLSSSNIQKLTDAFRLYRNHLNFSFLFSIFCVFRLSF